MEPASFSLPERLNRRRFLGSAAAAGLGLAIAPQSLRAATLDPARIKETIFPNGLRLIVKEARATDLASVQVWIRAGGFLEDENTAGTAHVIEHLVFKGTETRAPGSIDDEIENLGGVLEASTEKDFTRFTCTVSGRYVGKVLTVIADALRAPKFRPEDFEAEKPVIREEIEQVRIDPEAALSVLLYDLAYQKHPYKWDVRGNPRFLNTLDLNAVKAYFQKYYVPAGMTVVVVGDVDPAGVERVVRTAFQADRPGPKAPPYTLAPDEMACAKPDRRVLTGNFVSGYLGIAYPAPSVKDDPDVYAMDLLLTMVEHGGSGRLPRLLKGTAAVRALYETRRQSGLFLVTAATGRGDVEHTEVLIRRELEFFAKQLVPASELNLAKRTLRGSFALDAETYSGQASSLAYYDIIDRWQFATSYLEKINAITQEQVLATAQKYLQPERCVAVLLKPRGAANPQPPRSGA